MTSYYKQQLKKGTQYEKFICSYLENEHGIIITIYPSKIEQHNIGESKQGIEIKFDQRFHETGNLFIETEEKTNAKLSNWTTSGIYRDDNTWLYIIGDCSTIHLFGKKQLQLLCETYIENIRMVESETNTSKGFLLSPEHTNTHCLEIYKTKLKWNYCLTNSFKKTPNNIEIPKNTRKKRKTQREWDYERIQKQINERKLRESI